MGPTANARIDSEYFSGQDQLSTTQHAGVQFTKSKHLKTNKQKRLIQQYLELGNQVSPENVA